MIEFLIAFDLESSMRARARLRRLLASNERDAIELVSLGIISCQLLTYLNACGNDLVPNQAFRNYRLHFRLKFRSATRQRCCVANVSDVTVLAAGPVVAIVKITSAHMLCPFVVVVSLHGLWI